jgi:hypothetical protein
MLIFIYSHFLLKNALNKYPSSFLVIVNPFNPANNVGQSVISMEV